MEMTIAWVCQKCTFENQSCSMICDLCRAAKPSSRRGASLYSISSASAASSTKKRKAISKNQCAVGLPKAEKSSQHEGKVKKPRGRAPRGKTWVEDVVWRDSEGGALAEGPARRKRGCRGANEEKDAILKDEEALPERLISENQASRQADGSDVDEDSQRWEPLLVAPPCPRGDNAGHLAAASNMSQQESLPHRTKSRELGTDKDEDCSTSWKEGQTGDELGINLEIVTTSAWPTALTKNQSSGTAQEVDPPFEAPGMSPAHSYAKTPVTTSVDGIIPEAPARPILPLSLTNHCSRSNDSVDITIRDDNDIEMSTAPEFMSPAHPQDIPELNSQNSSSATTDDQLLKSGPFERTPTVSAPPFPSWMSTESEKKSDHDESTSAPSEPADSDDEDEELTQEEKPRNLTSNSDRELPSKESLLIGGGLEETTMEVEDDNDDTVAYNNNHDDDDDDDDRSYDDANDHHKNQRLNRDETYLDLDQEQAVHHLNYRYRSEAIDNQQTGCTSLQSQSISSSSSQNVSFFGGAQTNTSEPALELTVTTRQCINRKQQEGKELRPLFLQDLAKELVTDFRFPRTTVNQRMVFSANSFAVDSVHHEREKRKNATPRSFSYKPGNLSAIYLLGGGGSRSSSPHTSTNLVGIFRSHITSENARALARNGGSVKLEPGEPVAEEEGEEDKEDKEHSEFLQNLYVADKKEGSYNAVEVQANQDEAVEDNKDAADAADAADVSANAVKIQANQGEAVEDNKDVADAADFADEEENNDEMINKTVEEKYARMKEEDGNIGDASNKNPNANIDEKGLPSASKAVKGDDDSDLPAQWHALSESIKGRVMHVVWARISGTSPWWPGIIYHPTGVSGDLLALTMNCIETKYLVYFYGSDDWAHVAFNAVRPFLDHFDEFQANPMPVKKGKGKKMSDYVRDQWHEGVELAKVDVGKADKWKRATWI